MKSKTLLVIGAKSDIGIAIAHKFAKEGHNIQLASRDSHTLKDDCSVINIRYGVDASFYEFDALDSNSHKKLTLSLKKMPDIAIYVIGSLGNQKKDENEIKQSIEIIRTNYEGLVSIFGHLANLFKIRGSGTLIGISSVAGDRGRASNYIYGSSKAGVSAFLSGLRNRLYPFGIHVLTVKPGFVQTKMTSHINLPKKLTTNPEKVANSIYYAYKSRKNIIYVMPIWKYIMLFIKLIPESFFKKMKL